MPLDPRIPLADDELEVLFRTWWSANVSSTPPGPHAVRSHVAWSQWLQQQWAAGDP